MTRSIPTVWPSMLVVLMPFMLAADSRPAEPPAQTSAREFTYDHGGIVRGPRDRKTMALIFTGGSFGEGAASILDDLAKRKIKASIFVTGDFIRKPEHVPLLKRMIREGHYVGPHSDAHLLYCPWDDRKRTLVSKEEFRRDLEKNLADLAALGMPREQMKFFVPPYEWYNDEIVSWADEMGLILVNFTPGTRSNADYLPDGHPRFTSSQQISRGILEYESRGPNGLKGFLLLLHLGVGPDRTDKMHRLLGSLIDELAGRGYKFARIDDILESRPITSRPARPEAPGPTGIRNND